MKTPVFSMQTPLGEPIHLYKNIWHGGRTGETLSIVSGIHGDQLNGLFLLSRLSAFLQAVEDGQEPEYKISGTIQLFPMVNFQAFQGGSRLWSHDHLDLDLTFPGTPEGDLADKLCHALYRETRESNYCLLVHSPNPHDEEFPHARLCRPGRKLRNLARTLGLEVVKEIPETPTLQLQLFYHWLEMDIRALMVTFGTPGQVDTALCDLMFSNFLNFMLATGVLSHKTHKPKKCKAGFFGPENEIHLASAHAGLFVPQVRVGESLVQGQLLGELRDIYSGELLEKFICPEDGFLVTLRHHPVVYEKESVATLLAGEKTRWPWPF